MRFPLCVGRMWDGTMFSAVCALPSPASAEGCCPSLFGWFTGTTAQSDFSCTFMSAVRFMAFADRSWSVDQDVQEISRFSCMLFLSVRGFLDYAGPTVHSRFAWPPCCLPPTRNEVGILIYGLFAAQSPGPPIPLSTLQAMPRDIACKTRGQDGFAALLSRRALSSPTTCRFIPALSGLPTTRSEYAGRALHFSIQLVLPRTVRRRCLGCQECQSKSKTGHASSAPACDLYAFLVTVQ